MNQFESTIREALLTYGNDTNYESFENAIQAILTAHQLDVERAVDAELLKACLYWEKNPTTPATYLMNRRDELKILSLAQLTPSTDEEVE